MTRFVDQAIPYPAAKDYGSRSKWPTLAVVWHMGEGKNVAQYLSRDPLRGVSVHYTVEQATDRWSDGEVVRCLPEDRISGSMNPRTIRRTDDPDGYYGATHAKAAIGRHWPDTSPNCLVISVEVAGSAKEGPTEAQQRSMVALWDELKGRYPRVVPLGHRDWQGVKPCPGRTAAMKAVFAAMGGHGKEYSEVRDVSTRDYVPGRTCTVRDGSKLYDHPGGLPIGTVDPPLERDHLGTDRSGGYVLIGSILDGKSRTAWVQTKAVSKVRQAPTPIPDCAGAVAAERERIATAVLAVIKGWGTAVDRFLRYTTQSEPALTASFIAAVLLAIVARWFALTDEDLMILGPIALVVAGVVIRAGAFAPATVEHLLDDEDEPGS